MFKLEYEIQVGAHPYAQKPKTVYGVCHVLLILVSSSLLFLMLIFLWLLLGQKVCVLRLYHWTLCFQATFVRAFITSLRCRRRDCMHVSLIIIIVITITLIIIVIITYVSSPRGVKGCREQLYNKMQRWAYSFFWLLTGLPSNLRHI